ncbi:Coi1 protein [Scheffersomyces xylosifermentans]|uniref:Coi1 protein n=1 Tax=Scheffersomyces xylosifermentans TaxID=1304137 RepID=UPI00315C6878
MVSVKTLSTLALCLLTSVNGFDLLRDNEGFAILPPTHLVLKHLEDHIPETNPSCSHVVSTVHKNGEVVYVNLNTHSTLNTGTYKRNYDNKAYHQTNVKSLFTREVETTKTCFNEEFDFGISQCDFDFDSYNAPTNCSSSTKYACVVSVEKQQDSNLKLSAMNNVPAEAYCYHKLSDAVSAGVTGGSCAH